MKIREKPVFRLYRREESSRQPKNRSESVLRHPTFNLRPPFRIVTHCSSKYSLKSFKEPAQSLSEARKRASATELMSHDLRALSRIVIAVDVQQWVTKWGLYILLERYSNHGKQVFHEPFTTEGVKS